VFVCVEIKAQMMRRVIVNGNVATTSKRMMSSKVTENLGSCDHHYAEAVESLAKDKREFTYLALGGARLVYASAARLVLMKFIASMSATADVMAMAQLEVDTSSIAEGTSTIVKWRGKPVFVKHRTDAEIADAATVDISQLRDPETDAERAIDPKWLVAIGVCTHLGCVPIANAGEYHGWFCPCHGSHYDTSGRIRKGPAPLNLEVPPYKKIDDKLIIG